jgi:hypothetical protein
MEHKFREFAVDSHMPYILEGLIKKKNLIKVIDVIGLIAELFVGIPPNVCLYFFFFLLIAERKKRFLKHTRFNATRNYHNYKH